MKHKHREKLASGFYTTVSVKVSNTGVITGTAKLSNQHFLYGYGAMWSILLTDKDDNVIWASKFDHKLVDPAASVFPSKTATSSKAIELNFPVELIARVDGVDIALVRYEKGREKTLDDFLETCRKTVRKVVDVLKEIED